MSTLKISSIRTAAKRRPGISGVGTMPHDRRESGSGSLSSLKNRAYSIDPGVWVGKSGITQSVIDELKKQLEKKGIVKVKMLKAALEENDKKELAKELAEKTGSKIVLQVGHVVTLYKAGKPGLTR